MLEDTNLAERHIALREQAGLTQVKEAKEAGVSPTTISGIESGKITRPHLRTILKLAGALGVGPDKLIRYEETEKKGQAPLEQGSLERRAEESAEANGPRHPTVGELRDKIQEMRSIEQRRRDDIERMGSTKSVHVLDYTRVWEWQAFDWYLRNEYGNFVDAVNAGAEIESPEMQRRCLEFYGQLLTLENLSAQARVVAGSVDTDIAVETEKTAHRLQEHLQEGRKVEQEVEK